MDILEELRRVIDLESKAIAGLRSNLGHDFEEAIRLLHACQGNVILTGVGKSGIIAQKIAATMVSTGTPAIFMHGAEGLHGEVGILKKEDILIAIGKSGESEELVTLLSVVRKIGSRIISITAEAQSTMAQNSDLVLVTSVVEEACPLNMAPTCSTTVALVLGDAMAMALMKLRNFQPDDFALFHPGGQLGKRLLLTVGDMMRSGESNPVVHVSSDMRKMLYEITSKRSGAVSVVDDNQYLLGLVTDYDIRRVLESGHDIFALGISDVMNTKPSFVYLEEKAFHALGLMEKREKPISVLPVLDCHEKVVGMIHLHDLVACGL